MLQHRKDTDRKILLIMISSLFLCLGTGCVSVNIAQSKPNKAEGLIYTSPAKPFIAMSTENADKAWQSEKTGNTISYFSECNSAAESQLKSIESENLNSLTHLELISSESKFFDERESLESTAQGLVDGIPVKMSLLVYKKNNCNFTLSFVGRKAKFDAELNLFEQFRKSFRYKVGASE